MTSNLGYTERNQPAIFARKGMITVSIACLKIVPPFPILFQINEKPEFPKMKRYFK